MHLRRALLLFAIVLGLAAIAASVSRSPEESDERAAEPAPSTAAEPDPRPTITPGITVSSDSVELRLDADRWERLRLDTGRAATLFVEADEPGQVEILGLGLGGFAEPLTPARFELLVSDPGRYEIAFTPVSRDQPRPAGTLVVEEPGAPR